MGNHLVAWGSGGRNVAVPTTNCFANSSGATSPVQQRDRGLDAELIHRAPVEAAAVSDSVRR